MTPRLLLSLALGFFCAASAWADTFEGKIDMTITTGSGQSQTIAYEVRGEQVRINVAAGNGQGASMIMDLQKEQMLIMIPQRKMYLVRPLPAMGPGAASGPGNTQPTTSSQSPDLVQTGEKTTLLGYPCTKYTVSQNGATTEVWVTDALGNFVGFGGMGRGQRGGGAPSAWEQALIGKGFFPLKVSGTDSQGHSFQMVVTSVQKGALPDSDFSPPAGYQEFNMGNIMGGMGGYGH